MCNKKIDRTISLIFAIIVCVTTFMQPLSIYAEDELQDENKIQNVVAEDIIIQQNENFDINNDFRKIEFKEGLQIITFNMCEPNFDTAIPGIYIAKYNVTQEGKEPLVIERKIIVHQVDTIASSDESISEDSNSTNNIASPTETNIESNVPSAPVINNVDGDYTIITHEEDENGNVISELKVKNSEFPKKEEVRSSRTRFARAARAGGIDYLGKFTYSWGSSYVTYGRFTVYGVPAFCMNHKEPTPGTGTDFNTDLYNDENIRKVLYYGWNGPANVFGDDIDRGYALTTMALSYFYAGAGSLGLTQSGIINSGLQDFLNLCSTSPMPSKEFRFSPTNINAKLNSDRTIQQTDNITLVADPTNSALINCVDGVGLHNVSTGITDYGWVTVKGGETFYLTAPLNVTGIFATGNITGTMLDFQPMIAYTPGGYQNLGYWDTITDPSAATSLTVKWLDMGSLQLQKIDAETNKAEPFNKYYGSFKDTVYDIFKKDSYQEGDNTTSSSYVKSITLDDIGKGQAEQLLFGDYYAIERNAPSGYLKDNKIAFKLPSGGANPLIATITSKEIPQKGIINLQKVDAETNKADPQGSGTLENAKYQILDNANREVEVLTTDKLGKAKSSELPLGRYYLKEIKAPEGYNLDPTIYTIDITAENTTTRVFNKSVTSKENIIRGNIELYKFGQDKEGEDNEIKNPLMDVEFTLTHKVSGEKVVIVTDQHGKATTANAKNPRGGLKYGIWKVEETKTPFGYQQIKPFEITIDKENSLVPYIIEDKIFRACIQVEKLDKETGNRVLLPGTTFKIVNKDTGEDVIWTTYYPHITKFVEFETDEQGQCILPNKLDSGHYKLIELKAPNGYTVDSTPIDFTVDRYYDWEKPLVLTSSNDNVKGKLTIKKTDEKTNKPLENITFKLMAKENIYTNDGTLRYQTDQLIEVLKTNKEGIAESTVDLYLGKYFVQEEKGLPGYVCDRSPIEVEFTYEGQNTELVYKTLEIKNKPTKVVINKTELGNRKKVLEGVKFDVWKKETSKEVAENIEDSKLAEDILTSNNLDKVSVDDIKTIDSPLSKKKIVKPDIFDTYVTDEKGSLEIDYLEPGTYCIQESETIKGYVLDDTIHEVTIDKDGYINQKEVGTLKITNNYTKLLIEKVDGLTKKLLAGAELELLKVEKKDGKVSEKVIASFTSSEKKGNLFERLEPGDYILKETKAPENYKIANDLKFTLKETEKIQKVIMKDELEDGAIKTSMPKNFKDGLDTSGKGNVRSYVKTGDNNNVLELLIFLFLSGSCILGYTFHKKKMRGGIKHE